METSNPTEETPLVSKDEIKVFDAIYGRRAVRNYFSRRLDASTVRLLLDAATQAPSAMNSQPWAFVVIQNPNLLRAISEEAKEFLKKMVDKKSRSEHAHGPFDQPGFDIFYGATTLIVICAKSDGFEPVGDCYLAGQNLMLAAYGLGLGTCPIGFAREVLQTEYFRGQLAIPKSYTPVLPLIVGYPKGKVAATPRHSPNILCWLS
ncbi:MAG: nitroreductase family protein [Pseudobdellovibrionaceae bacterium]